MDNGKIVKSDDVRIGLISLIDNKKNVFHGGMSEIVKKEFELIFQARENGATWTEIVETLGFKGKEDGFSLSFWREKKRREKRVVPDVKIERQKESTSFRSEEKLNGGKIGTPRAIGRGRISLGEDHPDDEL